MKKRADGRWQKKKVINGKAKVFYSTAATERAAIRDIENQMIEYREQLQKSDTFKYIADDWDSEYRTKISEINYRKNTKAAYERILGRFEKYNINEITPLMINSFIQMLITQQYSQKTIAAHKCILNMIFSYAMLNGHITSNPMQALAPLPKNLPKSKRRMPTTAEIKQVEQHHDGFDLFPYFLLYTGCRRSEALGITDKDIDYKNKLIKIRNHVIHDGNRPVYESVLKSDAAERDIILLDRLAEKIPRKFTGFLFSMNGDGKEPLTKRAYDCRWEKYCKTYNLPDLTAHQLRHGYATMLFEAGIEDKDACELMGHSDIKLTRDIYTHIRNERKELTASKLNAFNF